jgi:hypothetical protein
MPRSATAQERRDLVWRRHNPARDHLVEVDRSAAGFAEHRVPCLASVKRRERHVPPPMPDKTTIVLGESRTIV